MITTSVSILLASCSLNQAVKPSISGDEPSTFLCADNYAYLEDYSVMTEKQLQSEMHSIGQSLEASTNYCPSLRLAILMTTPNPIVQADDKAILLFNKLLTDEQLTERDQRFARTMLKHLHQREQLRKALYRITP